jgi:hypothetical protein
MKWQLEMLRNKSSCSDKITGSAISSITPIFATIVDGGLIEDLAGFKNLSGLRIIP